MANQDSRAGAGGRGDVDRILFTPTAVAGAGDKVKTEGEFQRTARAGRCAGARQLGAAASSAAGGQRSACASAERWRRRCDGSQANVSSGEDSDSELSGAGSDGGDEAGASCVAVWDDG